VLLPPALLDAIYAHAEAGYPEEVCGLIFAGRAEADQPYPAAESRRCENQQAALHAEDPARWPWDARRAYELGIDDLFALDRSLGSDRPARIIYHSHVEVGAYFSEEDARAAAPDGELLYPVDHLVIDVKKDGAHGHRLFRFEAGQFVEIEHAER